jgi:MerR family transcriptional regulator, light-induced transcriptional regulator
VGERWHTGRLGPSHEHVVSVAARRVLTWLLAAYTAPAGAPVLVATTVAGEQHEFGALMVSVLAMEEGWRVSYLGASLPAGEIVRAAVLLRARLVALSIVGRENGPDPAASEIAELRRRLPPEVLLVAGGAAAQRRAAELGRAGALVMEDVEAFSRLLREERARAGAGT